MKVIFLSVLCALSLSSCVGSGGKNTVAIDASAAYKPASGSLLTLAGPVTAGSTGTGANSLYGLTGGTFGKELQISLSSKTAVLFENGSIVMQSPLLDTKSLDVGTYQITLKQRDPLWYAPDDYFTNRQMPVPASGEKERYLRGAFGSYALFLSQDKVLHGGDYCLNEVPGLRVDEASISKIFSTLDSGDSVVIKQ